MSDVRALFTVKSGSVVWPSSDPNDSPYDKYTCKVCGKSARLLANGSHGINEPSFDERIEGHLSDHLATCAGYKK